MGSTSGGYQVIIPHIDKIYFNDILYTVKSAKLRASSSGDTQIIAAVASKQLLPLAIRIGPSNGAVDVALHDTSNNVLAGPWDLAANGGIVDSVLKEGAVAGQSGERMDVNLSGAVAVTVEVWYIEV